MLSIGKLHRLARSLGCRAFRHSCTTASTVITFLGLQIREFVWAQVQFRVTEKVLAFDCRNQACLLKNLGSRYAFCPFWPPG